MQIIAIEKLTKTKCRIVWDDDSQWILKTQEVNELSLTEGLDLDEDLYKQLYEDYVVRSARKRALNLLEKSDYSKKELENRLFRDGFPLDAVKDAIEYVEGYHYVDDERYAYNFMNYKSHGKSAQMIYQTLAQKGISSDIIEQCMSEAKIDDVENIKSICEKKFGDVSNLSPEKRMKICNFFLRRGYKYNDILSVIKEFDSI